MSDIEVQQMEENILRGVALAYERLVEQKKKEDGELVFAREDGKMHNLTSFFFSPFSPRRPSRRGFFFAA